MVNNRTLLALLASAVSIMLVGCKQPIGVPGQVHATTTHTIYCTIKGGQLYTTGHIDFYQWGPLSSQHSVSWGNDDEITRAYTGRRYGPYPRQVGVGVFQIPSFNSSSGMPACTLEYCQCAHSGSADLLVNAHVLQGLWPGYPENMYNLIMSNTDTVATDSTHASDGWYKVPLSAWACQAIADSGAAGGAAEFYTGWVYFGTTDGDSTKVSGLSTGDDPFIKVDYSD